MYTKEVKEALLLLAENGFDTDYMMTIERNKKQITSPEAAFKAVKQYASETKEHVFVVSLDAKKRIINTSVVGVGTENACLLNPRTIMQQAVKDSAYAVIIAHNHPSGDTTPSDEDIATTKRIVMAGNIADIQVVDHIVFSFTGFHSIRENNSYKWDRWNEEAENIFVNY